MNSARSDILEHANNDVVSATEASTTSVLHDFPIAGSLNHVYSSRNQLSPPQQQIKNATDALIDAMKASTSREYNEFMEFLLGNPQRDAELQREAEEKAEEARMAVLHQLLKLEVEYHFAYSTKKLLLLTQQSLGIATQVNLLYGRFSYAIEDLLKDMYFQIESTHRDSNASFSSLNTNREQVTTALLTLIDDDYTRDILHEEIYQAIMNGDIRAPDYLQTKYQEYKDACEKFHILSQVVRARYPNVIDTNDETDHDFIKRLIKSGHTEQVSIAKRYTEYMETPAIILSELRDACKTKLAYHHYVTELGRKRSRTGKTLSLSYKSATILAKLQAFNLMIWRYTRACTELELAYEYYSLSYQETMHLLHISEHHYARLQVVDQPPSVADSPVIPRSHDEIRSILINHVKRVRKEHESLLKLQCETYAPKNPGRLIKFNEELESAVSAFLEKFDQKWCNHLTSEAKIDALLTELKTVDIDDHMSQCCNQIASKKELLLTPAKKTSAEVATQRVAQLTLLLQKKHGIEREAIPSPYRAYTDDMLLALAGQANLKHLDPITGDNLATIALQHRCVNIYHYLVVVCQVDAKQKNDRDKCAEDYFRVIQKPKNQLVPIEANHASFIESNLLIKQIQLSIQRYQATLQGCYRTLTQDDIPEITGLINLAAYRILKWIDPNPIKGLYEHIELRLVEAEQLLLVMEQALRESPTDFIRQFEDALDKTKSSNLFTAAVMWVFNVSSYAMYKELRDCLWRIKHDSKYRYLQNSAPQMKHEYDSKLLAYMKKMSEHEQIIADLKRQQEESDAAHQRELDIVLAKLQEERMQNAEYHQRISRLETAPSQHASSQTSASAASNPNRFQFASQQTSSNTTAAAAANPAYNS